eukprot:gene15745-18707_t
MKLQLSLLLIAIVAISTIAATKKQADALSFSGYFNVNQTTDANMFYWFFESQHAPSTDPLILWLTGGPGCSSELAVFYENGPWKLNEDLTTSPNPYSWNKVANVLYVDSPVGTGFSYVTNPDGYATNEDEVAANLYSMLTQFYAAHPKYANLPFYVFGESYAGHYVPAFSYYIYTMNQNQFNTKINLKGMAVGNAMVYPKLQYGSMGLMAYSHGLINELTLKETDGLYESCVAAIDANDYNSSNTFCNEIINVITDAAGPFNPYDVRLTCPPSLPLCYNFTLLTDYLAQPSVRAQLGVGNASWELCSNVVYADIISDWWNTEVEHIPILLAAGIDVMAYNGNMGFICGFLGTQMWVTGLDWPLNQQWNNAPRKIMMSGQTIGGYSQSYGGLTFVEVNNAGHMVPMDQPKVALEMVVAFLGNNKQVLNGLRPLATSPYTWRRIPQDLNAIPTVLSLIHKVRAPYARNVLFKFTAKCLALESHNACLSCLNEDYKHIFYGCRMAPHPRQRPIPLRPWDIPNTLGSYNNRHSKIIINITALIFQAIWRKRNDIKHLNNHTFQPTGNINDQLQSIINLEYLALTSRCLNPQQDPNHQHPLQGQLDTHQYQRRKV